MLSDHNNYSSTLMPCLSLLPHIHGVVDQALLPRAKTLKSCLGQNFVNQLLPRQLSWDCHQHCVLPLLLMLFVCCWTSPLLELCGTCSLLCGSNIRAGWSSKTYGIIGLRQPFQLSVPLSHPAAASTSCWWRREIIAGYCCTVCIVMMNPCYRPSGGKVTRGQLMGQLKHLIKAVVNTVAGQHVHVLYF